MSKARVDKIVQSWQQSGGSLSLEDAPSGDSKKQLQDEESHAMVSVELTEAYAEAHGGSGASCCTAFPLLLTRTWRELTRNKVELALQIFMNMFFSALFGVIYLRMPFSQKSIMDRTGLLFFQAMNGAFGSAINTSTAIPTQLQVVQRERTAGMYTIFPFCESHTHTHTHTTRQTRQNSRRAQLLPALPCPAVALPCPALHCMALTVVRAQLSLSLFLSFSLGVVFVARE